MPEGFVKASERDVRAIEQIERACRDLRNSLRNVTWSVLPSSPLVSFKLVVVGQRTRRDDDHYQRGKRA